jgi:hypothetical protein
LEKEALGGAKAADDEDN